MALAGTRVIHLYSGDDGQSHIREVDVTIDELGGGFGESFPIPNAGEVGTKFVVAPPDPGGSWSDYHVAPHRRISVCLRGGMEIDCCNGEVRLVQPGEIIFADDCTGRGHKTRWVESETRFMTISVHPDFNVDNWCTPAPLS
jgi:quercetin dioxygenase-like cupin family protein